MSSEANRRRIEDMERDMKRRSPKSRQSDSILMSKPNTGGWVETCPVFARGWIFTSDGQMVVVNE